MSENEGSEFGAGLAVCLAKFTEHLWNCQAQLIMSLNAWEKADDEERLRWVIAERRWPSGDSAKIMSAAAVGEVWTIGHLISMWMNGASEHFCDLDASAGPKLKELATLTLSIGHAKPPRRNYTMEHVERIRNLWREACLELDERLGVAADWGIW